MPVQETKAQPRSDKPRSDEMVISLDMASLSFPSATGQVNILKQISLDIPAGCLLYTSPSPRDRQKSRMPSSA